MVLGPRDRTRGRALPLTQNGIARESLDCVRQRRGIANRDQKPRFAVAHRIDVASNSRGDDRAPRRHRLDDRVGKALTLRAENRHVEQLVKVDRVDAFAREMDDRRDAEVPSLFLQRRPRRPAADEHSMQHDTLLPKPSDGVEQERLILHRNQPGDAADHELAARTAPLSPPFGAQGRCPFRIDGAERPIVDEVGHHSHAFPRHPLHALHGIRDGRAVRQHTVRHAEGDGIRHSQLGGGKCLPPAAARDRDRSPRRARPRGCKWVGVHVVAVDDVHSLIPEEPSQGEPRSHRLRIVETAEREPTDRDSRSLVARRERPLVAKTHDAQIEPVAVQPLRRSDGV